MVPDLSVSSKYEQNGSFDTVIHFYTIENSLCGGTFVCVNV